MPPSLRRRARQEHLSPQQADFSDSDDVDESQVDPDADDGDAMEDDLEEIEGEDDLEDEDGLASPGEPTIPLPNLDPPPPYLREISSLASWTVSSSKPGCSIPQLRHPSPSLFWQSDGPQPHYLNIHFNKLVRIVGLRLYLDFEQDESYTPTRIIFLAGSGMNDLQEWGEMRLESPRGWVWADFSGVGDAESDDSEDEPDANDNDTEQQHTIVDNNPEPHHPHHRSSDSENNAPTFTPAHPADSTDLLPDTTFDSDSDPEDSMHMDPRPHAHAPTHPHLQLHTPTAMAITPSLPRPTPRHPFTALSPREAGDTAMRVPASPRRPRLPVLRAHLVQVKILENHQNGKDTHLRGLQVFTRNDEGVRAAEPAVQRGAAETGGGAGAGAGKKGRSKSKKNRREDVYELGGLGKSTWDMEPSIR